MYVRGISVVERHQCSRKAVYGMGISVVERHQCGGAMHQCEGDASVEKRQ